MTSNDPWQFPSLELSLPPWVSKALPDPRHRFHSDQEKMMLVIDLSRLNIQHGTGGPFGAAVFDAGTQRLVAPGVNLVQALGCSAAHAEMVAIAMAQKRLGLLDLGARKGDRYELFSSAEPCAMCMGCIPWSGLRRLVCGARDEDARAIGFDEGIKAGDWPEQFRRRGIDVSRDVCREAAVTVLTTYKEQGGVIYNGRRDG